MTRERLKYLLDRFLENKATEEELKEYADWYKETVEKGPDMLQSHTAKEYKASLYNRIINDIDKKEKQEKNTGQIIFMRWAAAACLVLIAGAFLLYNNRQVSNPSSIAEVKTIQPDSLKNKKTNFENHNNKNRRISLEDGSIVELFPESKLVCEFSSNRRELHLTGKGFFNVAKDSSRLFTVYSGQITTTALGTTFTISAYHGSNDTEVSLHTGKVVIKQIRQNGVKNMKDVYLLPGHSLTYNLITGMATLKPLKVSAVNERGKTPAFGSRTGYEATFNQAPLADVLDAIEKEYKVPIQYNKKELSDMYFSGHILETDSLARVLKRIALLHSLRINATAKGYTIRKDH